MISRNINRKESKRKEMDMQNRRVEEAGSGKAPVSPEHEKGIVTRLRNFPKSRGKSVMEKSRKIAATRLTPNASQELNRFESHNPQRDFNEERFIQSSVWRHEEMRSSRDDDSVSDYLIIPDRDRVI